MKDFLENWMCHANRLNYTFLVHSLDKELHEDLTARGIPSIVINESRCAPPRPAPPPYASERIVSVFAALEV